MLFAPAMFTRRPTVIPTSSPSHETSHEPAHGSTKQEEANVANRCYSEIECCHSSGYPAPCNVKVAESWPSTKSKRACGGMVVLTSFTALKRVDIRAVASLEAGVQYLAHIVFFSGGSCTAAVCLKGREYCTDKGRMLGFPPRCGLWLVAER